VGRIEHERVRVDLSAGLQEHPEPAVAGGRLDRRQTARGHHPGGCRLCIRSRNVTLRPQDHGEEADGQDGPGEHLPKGASAIHWASSSVSGVRRLTMSRYGLIWRGSSTLWRKVTVPATGSIEMIRPS